ncbi:MAG: TlpA disulfide reductase family protein [Verrucomicrobiota bacterium JB023]|nr:TlpA disulfide reductase family protein [Verrucomicrobiota bacterium JB023]
MKRSLPFFLSAGLMAGLVATPLFAASEGVQEIALASVTGQVEMPAKVPEEIDTEGLDLSEALVMLEGKYERPRIPYPENWKEMAPKERIAWRDEFMKTKEYEEYVEKAEAARAARPVFTTSLKEDGSFVFEGIKPSWYQLSIMIGREGMEGKPTPRTARAWALHQFIIEEGESQFDVGTKTLKLQNVVLPGDEAPEWVGTDYEGNEVKLSDYEGKYVLFDFWATWCGPCIGEIPNLKEVYKEFGGDRFTVVGLSIDNKIELPIKFEQKNPSPYEHVFLGKGARGANAQRAYGVSGIPSIWLIGPDGDVIARDLRGKGIKEAVRAALAEEKS